MQVLHITEDMQVLTGNDKSHSTRVAGQWLLWIEIGKGYQPATTRKMNSLTGCPSPSGRSVITLPSPTLLRSRKRQLSRRRRASLTVRSDTLILAANAASVASTVSLP